MEKIIKEGDKCPHCISNSLIKEKGVLEFIKGNESYDIDHLMCNVCYSTYVIE